MSSLMKARAHNLYVRIFTYFSVKDSTSFDLDVKNAGINIMIAFGESGGKPTIHADECSANVESVDIKLHGGKSWLYNLFRDKIAHVIKDKLKSLLCEEASKVVDKDAEKALAKLKLVVDIRKAVVLDYTMQSDPILEQGYIESYHKGEIFWSGSHKEAPFQPRVFPQSFDTSKMAYIWVSDYLLNTAGYALQNQGILQYYLGPRDLKPKDRHYLYTTCPQQQCIGKLINKLQNGFPNCEIYINMSTSIAPTIRIMNGQIFGNVQGAMTYYARLPNNTVKYLFMTAVNINVFLTASVHDNKITARVTSISPNVTVLDSQIGLISSTALTSILSNLGDSLLIPKLNELGAEGLPLPRSEQVAFKNPTLNLVKNAIVLGTDLAWHPQNVDLNKTTEGVDNNLYFNSKKSGESPIGARTNTLNVARDWSKGTAHHSFKKLFG